MPAAPWLSGDYASASECEDAARHCRQSLEDYLQEWRQVYLEHSNSAFRHQLEELVLKAVRHSNAASPVEMFLKGDHMNHMSVAPQGTQSVAQAAAFDEACRHSACLVGICQASHAAAKMAETVAEEELRHQGCRGSLSGLRSWLWAPTQCQLWAKALKKAWAFGFRMSMALTTTSLFFALAKPNKIWPHSNGPLWTLVTVVLILTPVQGATLQRALRRMAGTCVGSLAALGSVFLIDASGGRPELAVLSPPPLHPLLRPEILRARAAIRRRRDLRHLLRGALRPLRRALRPGIPGPQELRLALGAQALLRTSPWGVIIPTAGHLKQRVLIHSKRVALHNTVHIYIYLLYYYYTIYDYIPSKSS